MSRKLQAGSDGGRTDRFAAFCGQDPRRHVVLRALWPVVGPPGNERDCSKGIPDLLSAHVVIGGYC